MITNNRKQNKQYKQNIYNKHNDDEDFMSLDSFKSIKILEEIELIDNTLVQLYEQMDRYLDDAKLIWDEHIKDFIKSTDCNTMHYLTEYDSDKFLKFMATQRTFTIMIMTKTRLIDRKMYLMQTQNI